MRYSYLRNIVLPLLLTFSLMAAAQYETPVQYMDQISKGTKDILVKNLYYMSGMSHGKSARKVEKRRMELIDLINDTRINVSAMPAWKGDKSLRDSAVAYLKVMNIVFREDYGKIVNMEEIAEQSYDAMEAYMLAKDKAHEKLDEANDRLSKAYEQFAAKNNITLIDNDSEIENKAKIVGQVMDHANEVYLIFFKAYKQEAYLMEAINNKNLVAIEQNLNSLKKFAEEGLEKLKPLKGYSGDASLITAARNMMNYYKKEVTKGPVVTDYYMKEEDFLKLKKLYESKSAGKRTQQDVDQFNKAVNEINAAGNKFNNAMNELNREAKTALNEWNKTYNNYLDEYIPKQGRQ